MAKNHATYLERPEYIDERAIDLATAKRSRASIPANLVKWERGMPTIMYARAGYGWENGQYVKLSKKASGITLRHATNRRDRRASDAEIRRQRRRAHRRDLQERKQLWLHRDAL